MTRQPISNLVDLVRTVVIHDEMHVHPRGKVFFDLVEKPQELLMPVSSVASADRDAGSYVHRRKQRRNAMSLVIMRLARGHARRHRQNRFRPIERQDLALLIHTQHNGAVRRVQVQAHDISHFLDKLRVLGEFKVLDPMRLQSKSTPDPNDSVLRQAHFGSHQSSAPVRAVGGHGLQCLRYDLFDLLIRDPTRRTHPRLIQQAIHTGLSKSFPPLTDGRTSNVQFSGNLRVAHPLGTRQYDPSAHCHRLSGLWTESNGSQFIAVFIGKFQRSFRASRANTQVCCLRRIYATNFSLRTLAVLRVETVKGQTDLTIWPATAAPVVADEGPDSAV